MTATNEQLANMLVMTDELCEELLEELDLTHDNVERLVRYVWLVQSYPLASNGLDYYRDNLAKWVSDEAECYFGEHENEEEFTRYYIENYVTLPSPDWIVIDYEATWQRNLRYDFTTEDNGNGIWVWSDIY